MYDRRIPVGAGIERRAQRFETLGQLERVHITGPFSQRTRCHLRESFRVPRIARCTRFNNGENRDDGIRRHRRHDHPQAVCQNTRLEHRKVIRARRCCRRTRRRTAAHLVAHLGAYLGAYLGARRRVDRSVDRVTHAPTPSVVVTLASVSASAVSGAGTKSSRARLLGPSRSRASALTSAAVVA